MNLKGFKKKKIKYSGNKTWLVKYALSYKQLLLFEFVVEQ